MGAFQKSRPLLLRSWAVVGFVNFIVGLAGVPGDLTTWSNWIDAFLSTSTALSVATHAVSIADFVNQEWVRLILVASGIIMVIWPLQWFWRIRHEIFFVWRKTVASEVFLVTDKAIALIAGSRWAQSRRKSAMKPKNIFDYSHLTGTINPSEQEQERKFRSWCMMALDKFCEETPNCKQIIDGKDQYNETNLRNWLRERYDYEVISEFGPP